MSVKLKIENLPQNISSETINQIFSRFPGFKSAQLLQNPHNQSLYGLVYFQSYEQAIGTKNYLDSNPPIPSENLKIEIFYENFYPQPVSMSNVKSYSHVQPYPQKFANIQYSSGINQIPYQNYSQQIYNPSFPNPRNDLSAQFQIPQKNDSQNFLQMMDQFTQQNQQKPESYQLKLFDVPENATSCLYVDGVPSDATEREIAHIFRPYPGFLTARLIPKVSKMGRKYFYCFVDFEDSTQATISLQTLQGYRFHWKDRKGLKISYATPTSIVKKRRVNGQSQENQVIQQLFE